MDRSIRKPSLIVALMLLLVLVTSSLTSSTAGATGPGALDEWDGAADEWSGAARDVTEEPRSATPEDRYALAGGCYAVTTGGAYVQRAGDGFAAIAASASAAEPFRFQATDLGRYLLFGSVEDFVAADGDAVVAAAEPSDDADWAIKESDNGFSITLPSVERALTTDANGTLVMTGGAGSLFGFELVDGCATYPEIEVNVEGPVVGGQTPYQEVRGFVDAHLHMMAFEFLGGRARCGRPWHRFGVAYALVDCPDHEPGGYGAVLEKVVSRKDPHSGHNTDGWPTFEGWPQHDSLTHEQVYYKWLERAWRGGLRMFTNLLVDNNQLCKLYPLKQNSCNEMDGVRLQAKRIRELEAYIDAQNGGPGEGWFRIVTDPFEAREVINQGKLAVVLGIEVSVPLDCGETLEQPRCDLSDVESGLDEVYDLGVRQMELVNKFDNAFSGVAGDSGDTGVVVNGGNFLETGHFWKMDTCPEEGDGHDHDHWGGHDKLQHNFHDNTGAPDEFTGRDALAGAILSLTGTSGAAPVYPEGPHCNQIGLSELGEKMIKGMAERGIIFDPDHMSARAQSEAFDLLEELGYSGIVSSHGWSNDTIYPRIYELGGFVTPYAGGSTGFVNEWRKHREWADDRFFFGFGYGADTNGFGAQGGPRGADAENPVTYPFTGFGGVTVEQQQSGTRTYDINSDGVDHYGLYPDWIEDLRRLAGDAIVEDMTRGAEAYLQTWERAIGIAPDSCRADVADLTQAQAHSIRKGTSAEEVVRTLGQPSTRTGTSFTYCVERERSLTVTFSEDGQVTDAKVQKS